MRIDGDRLHLAVIDQGLEQAAFAPDAPALTLLERLLATTTGRRLQVEPLARSGGGADGARNPAYAQAQAHPLVKDLLERFEAEIVAREPSPRERFLERRRDDESSTED